MDQKKVFTTTITGQFKTDKPRVFMAQTQFLGKNVFPIYFDGYRLDHLKIDMEITHASEIDLLIEFLKYTKHCFMYEDGKYSPRNPEAGGEYENPIVNFKTKKS